MDSVGRLCCVIVDACASSQRHVRVNPCDSQRVPSPSASSLLNPSKSSMLRPLKNRRVARPQKAVPVLPQVPLSPLRAFFEGVRNSGHEVSDVLANLFIPGTNILGRSAK